MYVVHQLPGRMNVDNKLQEDSIDDLQQIKYYLTIFFI